ncbi:F0F1 ATP synthase subunit delta [Neobacillus mesonae]|uniref:F0F1 ATP synthase subunit delta n=1 Tax=Neobacillus mesonae TaxID=1193713 RepID=UPI00203AFE3C|nr:F0F1 ATP synthase subunit delta [Neobacillus mesonae]MCM3567214.1 F0F1 ATP synthase subunit delta [Neobacillus mesonae]
MSNSLVAKRYASALFQIAKEQQIIDSVEEELRVVKEVLETTTGLKDVLHSSKLTIEQKKMILKNAFSNKINPNVLNLLLLLIDRHREGEINDVVDQFTVLANDEMGVAKAKVYTIRPLSDKERDAISAAFAAKAGKKSLQIENIVDTDLLGGVLLRIGNRIYDGSLIGKLNRLESKLLG